MRGYSPEFLTKLQHAYEQTERPLRLMAMDFVIGERTLYRIAHREGWTRMPRGLPPAMRVLEEASALLSMPNDARAVLPSGEGAPPRSPSLSLSRLTLPRERGRDEESLAEGSERTAMMASAAERIAELVQKELAAAEVMRAQLRAGDCAPIDAERMARTLSTLTQTLQTLQRLNAGEIARNADDDDDLPRDIDEFRRELARRLDALVASRTPRPGLRPESGPGSGSDSASMVERTDS
jgi:hypothetical protein